MTAKTQRREDGFSNGWKLTASGHRKFSDHDRRRQRLVRSASNDLREWQFRESHESGDLQFARFVRFVIQLSTENLSLRSLRSFALRIFPMLGTFAPSRLCGQLIAAFLVCCMFCFAVAAAGGASRSSVDATSRCPNILVIVADDQGYGDFGFTGNSIVQTPNLDRLSKQSAFYPHFMVGPACSPSRVSLLTGRNHLDTGVWGVGPRDDVRRDEVMMPTFFTPSGYDAWLFGKQAIVRAMELDPIGWGFDWYCGVGGYQHKDPRLLMPGKNEVGTGWTAEILTDRALDKIRGSGDTPWLMYMAYIIPHTPWVCPDSYSSPYREAGYSDALARCYGSIKQMDDQIGRLLAGLRDAGQEENTIVLFMSDNGPAEENRSVWTNNKVKGKRRSADWKLRNPLGLTGQKAEVWENGIRSPLLVRWPGKITPGVREETIMVEDILPTLLDLAGVPEGRQPKHLPFDGKSIRGSLEDTTFTEERDIFRLALAGPGCPATTTPTLIIEDARETDYSKLHTVLRRGRYKFHHLPGGEVRLYDMVNDPAEKNDLSRQMPERTEELAQRCRARWDDIASRNRTFPMRQLKIDNADRESTSWVLSANHALRFEGEMKSDYYGGAKGFRSSGDRADYTVEVQKPLTVSFVAKGKGFDRCAPISLLVDGTPVAIKSRSADKIEFGPAVLKAGTTPFSLAVPDDAAAGSADGEVITLTFKREK